MNYMTQYCISNERIEVDDIQDVLEDILDEEFDTTCEDDSPKGSSNRITRANLKQTNFYDTNSACFLHQY